MQKVGAKLALFSVEKAHMLHVTSDVIFIVSTLVDNGYEKISAREFGQWISQSVLGF